MIERVTSMLAAAGVTGDAAAALASLVVTPPPGSIDAAELQGASERQLTVLAAVVAATDCRRFGTALQCLLKVLSAAQTTLSEYDNGRFWHLKGLVALRLDDALYTATRALNRSLTFLHNTRTPRARAYLARVYDTFGQLLQHQGLLRDARHAFELALRHRVPADEEGTALTLGNLGRLCLDLGDFASAATYFKRDLDLITRRTPERTHLCTQLLSHLGTCALEGGRLAEAEDYFRQSEQFATADTNAYALAFAALGLGKIALRRSDTAAAQRYGEVAVQHLNAAKVGRRGHAGLRGLIRQLLAEIHLQEHRAAQAVAEFEAARQSFVQAPDVSPVETAQLLYGLARARLQQGEGQHASLLLREALQWPGADDHGADTPGDRGRTARQLPGSVALTHGRTLPRPPETYRVPLVRSRTWWFPWDKAGCGPFSFPISVASRALPSVWPRPHASRS